MKLAAFARATILVSVTVPGPARADQPQSATKRRPLATLQWIAAPSMVQRTSFVLYHDGLVLYDTAQGKGGPAYASIKLDDAAKGALLDSLSMDAKIASEYDAAPNVVDGMLHQVCVRDKCARVRHLDLVRRKSGSTQPTSVPQPLVDLIAPLVDYSDPRAHPWLPEHIPLRFYIDVHAGKAKRWPQKWLGAMQEGSDSIGPYFGWSVGGDQLRALHDFLDDRKAVRIDGRRGYVTLRDRVARARSLEAEMKLVRKCGAHADGCFEDLGDLVELDGVEGIGRYLIVGATPGNRASP